MQKDLLWQQAAFHKLKKVNGGIVWADLGEGKSRVALRLFAHKVATLQQKRHVLLIVCRRKSFYDWKNEIKKCGYSNWKVTVYNPDYTFVRYSGVSCFLVSADILHNFGQLLTQFDFDQIIFDELYLFSNVKAARTKAAIRLTEIFKMVVGISATIMPAKDNATIWGQASVIGISHLLARNLTDFRRRFQNCQLIQMGARKIPVTKNKAGSEGEIHKALADHTYLHFPKPTDRKLIEKFNEVPQTSEQKKLIKQLKEEYYVKLSEGNELDIKVATSLMAKIQQISNGYIKDNRGNTHFIRSAKYDALEQSVTEALAANEQVLIWCAFRSDLEYLADRLPVATLQLKGGSEFDLNSWQSGLVNVVLATEGSGASLNHFSKVRYAKYFSMSPRWLDLQQSKGRTYSRNTGFKVCHYEFFFTADTFDRHIYDTANKSGATEQDFIKSGILKSWLKQK